MKTLSLTSGRLLLPLIGLLLLTLRAQAAEQCVYVSAGGKIHVHEIKASGELSPLQELEVPGAGPIGVAPDGRTLYVKSTVPGDGKSAPAGIATVRVKPDGTLELLHNAPSTMAAGYISVDETGQYLAGNNYGEGRAALWKLADGVFRGDMIQQVELAKKAHSAVFAPGNRFLLVPATEPNKVFQLRFDAGKGTLAPNDPPHAEGPTGDDEARQPRHLIFHPTLKVAYTTNEREHPGVGVWKWDPEKGALETVQNIISKPVGFEGEITTADLHLTPNGRFLYISNRDTTDRNAPAGRDSIAAFHVDSESGLLKMVGLYPCPRVPRSFDVDATGRFLYVSGQVDGKLQAFDIDQELGTLEAIATYEAGDNPAWVTCVIPPAAGR